MMSLFVFPGVPVHLLSETLISMYSHRAGSSSLVDFTLGAAHCFFGGKCLERQVMMRETEGYSLLHPPKTKGEVNSKVFQLFCQVLGWEH